MASSCEENASAPTAWRRAPLDPCITAGEVHVWRAELDVSSTALAGLEATLTEAELDQARRYRLDHLGRRFIASRAVLKDVLARYLAVGPAAVEFTYGRWGKPALGAQSGAPDIRFNLTHSEGMALVAVALGRETGVDLERLKPEMATEAIADRFFSPEEAAEIRTFSGEAHTKVFFACWTRKEAYLKAKGEGLSFKLDRFRVSVLPGAPAALLSSCDNSAEPERWAMTELEPGPGFVASMVVEAPLGKLKLWRWGPPE